MDTMTQVRAGQGDGQKGNPEEEQRCRFAFCASTGRTATMFLATTLNTLPDVVGLHEGQVPGDPPVPRLPLINLHNRKAWHEPGYAEKLVAEMRDSATLWQAAGNAAELIDVAFYNAPLLQSLAQQHPDAALLAIFRRCEGFVRSATIVKDEDFQPAGWPDRSKSLSDREKFISLGRLRPEQGSDAADLWPNWSAIQRNIWLWTSVNSHLLEIAETHTNCHTLFYENLNEDPDSFWAELLRALGIDTDANFAQCIARSASKVNQRLSYQIGTFDTWNDAERALYEDLALPLERKIYG
jgi:hypothetical protein